MMDYNDRVAKQESAMWNQASVGQRMPYPKDINMGLRGALPSLAEIREKEAYMQQREAANQCTAESSSPMKEIPRQMNRLFNVTDCLEHRVKLMEDALDSVLAPEYPAVPNGGELKANVNTCTGQAIDGIVERLERVAARMAGLIERVQV